MKDNLWNGCIPYKDMNIVNLSKTLKDAIDSFKKGFEFRDTKYRFNEASLKEYICAVCKDNDNRSKILKIGGELADTFVVKLKSRNNSRLLDISEAIKDEPELKGLCEKIKKMVQCLNSDKR